MFKFCPQCTTPLEQRLFEERLRPTCPNCGFIIFADPKVAATVLIERNNMVLLIKRAVEPQKGTWCLPGGYVDFGEDPVAAAIRECREETGLNVINLRLLDVGFNGRVIVITYTARIDDQSEPMASDDAEQVGWFRLSELPPLAFDTMNRPLALWQQNKGDQD